jgi:tryptophan-rich sensory protein
MKRLLPLVAIEVFVWLILILTVFVISKGAFAITFGTSTLIARVATQVARVSTSAALVLVWLLAWKKLADYYLSRMLARQGATA